MRLLAQGLCTLGLTAATVPQQLITTDDYPAGQSARYIWLGASANAGACHVGLDGAPADLPHYLASDDQKGFEIEHDAPHDLFVVGTPGDKVKWAIYND